MNPFIAAIVNGVVLIVMSVWAYFDSQSFTALIPAAFGVVFLALSPGVKTSNKAVAHAVVVLAILLLIALVRPLMGTLERGSAIGTARIAIMIVATLYAIACYGKSFVDARKSRA